MIRPKANESHMLLNGKVLTGKVSYFSQIFNFGSGVHGLNIHDIVEEGYPIQLQSKVTESPFCTCTLSLIRTAGIAKNVEILKI